MFPSNALLSLLFVFIALSAVDATPLSRRTGKATLGFTARINERDTGLSIVEKDRARAKALKQAAHLDKRDGLVSVANTGVIYTAQVGVGNPPTIYTLQIDTGSSNTWVGANKSYVPTSTSHDTGNKFALQYGKGFCFGEEWTDTVTLSPDLVIEGQSIGVATLSSSFDGYDGFLGVGPTDLTEGTVENTPTVPTVTDNLYTQKTISQEVLGIYYIPASELISEGELTFGGYDKSVITSDVNYVPLTKTSPASIYWGIDQSISYGSQTILSTTAGIVDTGTTLILIASNAFQEYQTQTGSILDPITGLLFITSSQYNDLQSLWFNVGSTSYELTPNGQIWPRSLNHILGGSSSGIYLIVSDLGTPSGEGLDFIDGYTFLERYYSVFDTANSRVGLASTKHTNSVSN